MGIVFHYFSHKDSVPSQYLFSIFYLNLCLEELTWVITTLKSCYGIKKYLEVTFNFINLAQKEKRVAVGLDLNQVLT